MRFLLLLVLFVWCASAEAACGSVSSPIVGVACTTQGEAFSAANALAAAAATNSIVCATRVRAGDGEQRYYVDYQLKPYCNGSWGLYRATYWEQSCAAQGNEYGWNPDDTVCHNGCTYKNELFVTDDPNSPPWRHYPTGETCSVSDETPSPSPYEPPSDPPDDPPTDPPSDPGDGSNDPPPSDQPNPPPPSDPSDPEEPTDPDNPGPPPWPTDPSPTGPDDGDDHTASGGLTCGAPPTCGGDAIMCAQLYQQWRIRCNTESTPSVSGGATCQRGDMPVCSGDGCNALAYAAVLQQWRTRCQGDANANGQPDWTELKAGEGSDGRTGHDPGDVNAIHREISSDELIAGLDHTGFLGGGSCPVFPVLDIGRFGSYDMNAGIDFWCPWLEKLGAFFVFISTVVALRILME